MNDNLADPNMSPGIELANVCLDCKVKQPPVRLRGLAPVVEAKHDGEGAGGQQLLFVLVLLVLVIQTVSRRQCESVSNLGESKQKLEKVKFDEYLK